MQNPPIPQNEMERVVKLSDYDLDYSELQENFRDLSKLAAKVAGTPISMVNLIDTFTVWTVSDFGMSSPPTPREDSICQYTIVQKESFEIKDMTEDDRFSDRPYVTSDPHFRYYFGVPLVTDDGYNLGALCVLDKIGKEISPEKVELLKIIANEIIERLNSIRMIQDLKYKVKEAKENQRKVAHDIRGPLSGIIGLSQTINDMNDETKLADVQELVKLIHKGGNSILELADEILGGQNKKKATGSQFTLVDFQETLVKLYGPQAINKQITLDVVVDPNSKNIPVLRNKLLQIAGNLISNAIKFTPVDGKVTVHLGLIPINEGHDLHIIISDTGEGINAEKIKEILAGSASSTDGTKGELGYGFGMALVKHLVEKLKGTLALTSTPGKGSTFTVVLPQNG